MNFRFHEIVNENFDSNAAKNLSVGGGKGSSNSGQYRSSFVLRGILKGCAEQNALGALAAAGKPYSSVRELYILSTDIDIPENVHLESEAKGCPFQKFEYPNGSFSYNGWGHKMECRSFHYRIPHYWIRQRSFSTSLDLLTRHKNYTPCPSCCTYLNAVGYEVLKSKNAEIQSTQQTSKGTYFGDKTSKYKYLSSTRPRVNVFFARSKIWNQKAKSIDFFFPTYRSHHDGISVYIAKKMSLDVIYSLSFPIK